GQVLGFASHRFRLDLAFRGEIPDEQKGPGRASRAGRGSIILRGVLMKKRILAFALATGLSVVAVSPSTGSAADPVNEGMPRKGWSFKEAGMIPVLSGGRFKPLD